MDVTVRNPTKNIGRVSIETVGILLALPLSLEVTYYFKFSLKVLTLQFLGIFPDPSSLGMHALT